MHFLIFKKYINSLTKSVSVTLAQTVSPFSLSNVGEIILFSFLFIKGINVSDVSGTNLTHI